MEHIRGVKHLNLVFVVIVVVLDKSGLLIALHVHLVGAERRD